MAKEQVHNWLRTFVMLAAIVFAGGGYVMKINGNSNAIADGKAADKAIIEKVEDTEDDIITLRLQYKDIESLAKSIDGSLKTISSGQTSMSASQGEIRTDIEVMKVKVDTLTKD